jgi:eukaryotic-like serine/threonine-protein kinase
VKQCPRCSTSYADDVSTCPLDGASLSGAARGDPFVGRTIKGRYRIVSRLGDGGMGTVYRAEQLSLGRTVALKLLHREFARDAEFVERFQQEARLAAGLNHPRLTTVYEFDQSEDGSLFIVMEYLEGMPLSDLIRQSGPLAIARAVGLGIQIAEGIEAAHAAGVIHRDVKPQNVMVLSGGTDAKLMDFGIARLNDGRDGHLTRAGTMMGTPLYMAPEQIEGRPVSERTDIYAFGVVLYEMLSGQTPFTAPTSAAILAKQLNEPPRLLRSVRADVPALLERIVMQALDKDPEYRQERIAEVVRGLRAIAASPMSAAALAPEETFVGARTLGPRPAPGFPTPEPPVDATMVSARTIPRAEVPAIEPSPASPAAKRPSRRILVVSAAVLIVIVAVGVALYVFWPTPRLKLHALTDGAGHGSVTVTARPPASGCGEGCFELDRGASVTLTAMADQGSQFERWSKPGCPEASCTTSVTESGKITATFALVRPPDPGPPPGPQPAPPPLVSPETIKGSVRRALSMAKLLRDPPDSEEPGVEVASVGPDGVVTLRGVLRNEVDKRKAREAARTVPGVKAVVDSAVNVRWD